jgi:hypothetical protein
VKGPVFGPNDTTTRGGPPPWLDALIATPLVGV